MAADPLTKSTVSNLLRDDFEDEDDVFNDIDKALELRDGKTTLTPPTAKRKADSDRENDILGLDQEVKITKRRKQIAKLDEARYEHPALRVYAAHLGTVVTDRPQASRSIRDSEDSGSRSIRSAVQKAPPKGSKARIFRRSQVAQLLSIVAR